ncbi:hypothetical protein QUA30_06640 [Microcoleus sp. Pol14C2]|uniref:hypothetical protein n=1 Tax=unclassified Microcoleus TaxID=2642155 RepID=UPI002FCE761E
MLIFPAKADAVAIGIAIFWILPTPNSAAILTWGRIFAFFPIPPAFFTKTLIYLILLNNLAFPEKANKGDRSMRWFGALQPQLQGRKKQTLLLFVQHRIYRRKEISPDLPSQTFTFLER